MEPISGALSAFNATYRLILFSIDIDQVPSQVRRSLELVQTCHRDLQHLIEIRQECLSLLQQTPVIMNRVNEIIAVATQGLVEVCQIVEKCRPGAHNGKIPFKNRVAWVMFDSKEFKTHEPVISRHHSSVLSELNFLRQSALLAAHTGEKKPVTPGIIGKSAEIFDNVALLGGLMSGMVISGNKCRPIDSTDADCPFSRRNTK
ncbi:hypothetical protein CPLU01_04880 [Colletotrichum plurivorum]|uniref:Uncharacterized protein n=1 Tax=Colletotrichum plurivorum TaxID=2175906 RepID=A0A8H6KNH3_9PEZI|nr:hypothetical protein CPLU01_04880 [Colletotrichum plurivorum]